MKVADLASEILAGHAWYFMMFAVYYCTKCYRNLHDLGDSDFKMLYLRFWKTVFDVIDVRYAPPNPFKTSVILF